LNKNILILFLAFCFAGFDSPAQKLDSIPVLNTLRYFDIGTGTGIPGITNALNAGLSLDIDDILALFIEYNMYFDNRGVILNESNIKAGPYYQFNWNSYAALSAGFSYMFTTKGGNVVAYNVPVQLRYNLGIAKWLSVGIKGTYNIELTKYADTGSVILFLGFKFRN
jgi:hypothetical protein